MLLLDNFSNTSIVAHHAEAENVLPTNSEPEKVLVPIETRGGVAGAAPSVSPAAVTAAVTPTAAVAPIAAMTPSQEKKEILTTPAVRKLAADKGVQRSCRLSVVDYRAVYVLFYKLIRVT